MNSRAKGQRGEREWANVLRLEFPEHADDIERGIQSRHGGAEVADVIGVPGFHFEVKRRESFSIWKALEQAESEAKPDDVPVVPFRRNFGKWYVALSAEDFFDLIGQPAYNQAPTGQGEIQDPSCPEDSPANARIPREA